MNNQIIRQTQIPISEIATIGKAFAESGMFNDTRQAAQAIVKIQAGQEMGIPPFAAMSGIHIIQGKPTVGSGLIASCIKKSGKYDYKVEELTEAKCSIDFYEGKEKLGNSTFTIEEARKAGTKNLEKFPKNMLFARAISNGVKFYCPDVFSGPVYVPEEMESAQQTVEGDATVISTDNNTASTAAVIQDPNTKSQDGPEPIAGHWYAKLDKCKTKADLDDLALKNKETIEANPELKQVFKQYYAAIKKQSVAA